MQNFFFAILINICETFIFRGRKSPTHCYIVKIFLDSMLLTIKTIFIGDCSLDVRMRTINQIKRDLLNLEKVSILIFFCSLLNLLTEFDCVKFTFFVLNEIQVVFFLVSKCYSSHCKWY